MKNQINESSIFWTEDKFGLFTTFMPNTELTFENPKKTDQLSFNGKSTLLIFKNLDYIVSTFMSPKVLKELKALKGGM